MRVLSISVLSVLLLAACQSAVDDIPGCTYETALNYNPEATIDDGSCEFEVEGCTDPEALNYNPEATVDDGSCEFEVEGCTDPEALNYNPEATVDDGSCEYPQEGQPFIDGYFYQTVTIGSQVWFAENLRTAVYANGDSIPSGLTDEEWSSTTAGAATVYGEALEWSGDCMHFCPNIDACDEAQSLASFGRLYNWNAVDDSRGLCPSGWHVPSDLEWTELVGYIAAQGFEGAEGTALKSTTGWPPTDWNTDGNGTDDFGFSGLPGGYRNYTFPADYNFTTAGHWASWWTTSTSQYGNGPLYRALRYEIDWVQSYSFPAERGLSVRCIQD